MYTLEADMTLTTGERHGNNHERVGLANCEPRLEVHDYDCNCISVIDNVSGNLLAVGIGDSEFKKASERSSVSSLLDTLYRASDTLSLGRSPIDGITTVSKTSYISAVNPSSKLALPVLAAEINLL